jgi:hypothetical protein
MKLSVHTCFFLLAITTLSILPAASQNVTSPYSILGIGDVETKDFTRYSITGSASLARRDERAYNFANPASLSSLPYKTIHFDIAMRGRSSSFLVPGTDTNTFASRDFIVKRVSLAFKLNQKTGVAMGIKPFSSVNYRYLDEEAILDGNTSYIKLVEGNGGINQFYSSFGTSLSKHISIGATASWLFGSLQKTTQYFGPTIALNVTRQEDDFYNSAQLLGGIQYYSLPGRKWIHTLGLTASASTNLNGQMTTTYSEGSASISDEIEDGRTFKLPVTAGLGYSASYRNKLTFSVEANYYNWDYQKVDYKNSYTNPSARFSAGMEFSFKKKIWQGVIERSFVGLGFTAGNSYLHINNKKLWDYSFSFGGGLNPLRNLSIFSGVELGIRGQPNSGQIKENYTQFILGITLKDIWIGTKKFGRFN